MRNKIFLFMQILCLMAVLSPAACSDSEENGTPIEGDVYVAGGSEIGVTLWKNGVAQTLSETGSARSVFVSGNDVYVAGYVFKGYNSIPTLWKNGVAQKLSEKGFAESVFVSGNDVYVAGSLGDGEVVLWKNGVAQKFTEKGMARSVFVADNDVYVAGWVDDERYGGMAAVLWKNGVRQNLTDRGGGAYSVFVK